MLCTDNAKLVFQHCTVAAALVHSCSAVCIPGYGGPSCSQCSYGTFYFGGSTTTCRSCDAGSTSKRGAESATDCVSIWPDEESSRNVHIPLSNEGFWQNAPAGAATMHACKAQCGPGCIMLRYGNDAPKDAPTCQVLMALSSGNGGAWFQSKVASGFKAFGGGAVLDYAFSYVPEGLVVGELQAELGRVSFGRCLEACTLP